MISDKVNTIQKRMEEAKSRVGRIDPVHLIGVTKNHPPSVLYEAVDAGITIVGENRVQEAMEKHDVYDGPPLEWHLIGHLQRNKVKYAVPIFDLIHSVDSERLLREINSCAEKEGLVQRILLQVNVAREEQKYGISVEEYPRLIALAKEMHHVQVEGLMCMAPFVEDVETVRPVFRVASYLFEDTKKDFPEDQFRYLSMGMTHDFEIAIEEGANMVRVGTGIFGERDYH